MIDTGRTSILIDLGFGYRSLRRRLHQAELSAIQPDAILLTHGHHDHIAGVQSFFRNESIPLFLNEGTQEETPQLLSVACRRTFGYDSPFCIGDLWIEAFAVSHDSLEPAGFRFTWGGLSGALLTDLGCLDSQVQARIAGCDWLVLESNHDEELLKLGPYPWSLKQRVLSRKGHLSNQAVARFLSRDFDGSARHIFLAHLSAENNDPELALQSAKDSLWNHRFPLLARECRVHLTHQNKPSIVVTL